MNPAAPSSEQADLSWSSAEPRQAEAILRTLLRAVEHSPVSIVITDAKGNIEYVNPKFEQVSGYSRAEATGKNPRMLKSGESPAGEYRELWATISAGETWRGEFHNRRKDGTLYWEQASISPVLDEQGRLLHYVAVKEDITERKAAADEIAHLAYYDTLSALPNRRLLLDRLHQSLAASARNKRQGAVLFIDLDNFKILNDTRGHDTGDLLLAQVAQRLIACVREEDTVARLGGDEFVVMLCDLSENVGEAGAQAKAVGEKILDTLNKPYRLAGQEHLSTASIGVTLFKAPHKTVDELMKRADLAMYQAKAAGRNTLRFYDPQMQAVVSARASLEADLRQALRERQFLLHYQAQVIGRGKVTGAEALLRWQHPSRGIIYPLEFIPLAEETGLILQIGLWVLETACAQLAAWAARPETAQLTLAVNVSARQFHQADFVARNQSRNPTADLSTVQKRPVTTFVFKCDMTL